MEQTRATSDAPVQLSYGQQAPAWRRRRVVVPAVLIAGAVVAGWLAWSRVTDLYQRWAFRKEIERWHARALTWSEPPTKLKYTENPADAAGGQFRRAYSRAGSGVTTGYAAFGGTPMEKLPLYNGRGQLFLAGADDQVMLFMHERKTAAGLTRLVCVSNPRLDGNTLRLSCSQVGALQGEYRVLDGGAHEVDLTGIAGPGEIRLYAGQADPNDPSRFSIPFEARGRRGWLDGVYARGTSTSTDPAAAGVEAEANSGVVFSVRLDDGSQTATTAPTD